MKNAQIKTRVAVLVEELRKRIFLKIKYRFLGPSWIESGERAMRGAGPSEAPSNNKHRTPQDAKGMTV